MTVAHGHGHTSECLRVSELFFWAANSGQLFDVPKAFGLFISCV